MKKKIVVLGLAGVMLVSGFGCTKKEVSEDSNKQDTATTVYQNPSATDDKTNTSETPQYHPGASKGVNDSLDVANLEKQVNEIIDKKFPGEWTVDDDEILNKGNYVENKQYKITDEIAKNLKGSMVSIYVGETRISNTLTSHAGRLLSGYAVPEEVGKTMESGKAIFFTTKLNQHEYQKAYIPIKSKRNKTIGVIGLSIKINK